jgi:hypothetical protein
VGLAIVYIVCIAIIFYYLYALIKDSSSSTNLQPHGRPSALRKCTQCSSISFTRQAKFRVALLFAILFTNAISIMRIAVNIRYTLGGCDNPSRYPWWMIEYALIQSYGYRLQWVLKEKKNTGLELNISRKS